MQFLFVAITGYIAQFDRSRPPFFVAPNKVPLRRWFINIILFFTINVMNNHAFSYDISVPVHIILRSGGSITTMLAGYLYGKRYPRIQIVAVVLLTFGVILAAWSDAQTKVRKAHLLFASVPLLTSLGTIRWRQPACLQHRPGHSLHCSTSFGDHGTLHRGDLQQIWAAVEGELVLFAPTIPSTFPPVSPVNGWNSW